MATIADQPIQLDIVHIFFMELLQEYKNNLGTALAVRQMIQRALIFSQRLPRQDYEDKAAFLEALRKEQTIFNLWDRELEIINDDIIVASACPFRKALQDYSAVMGGVANEYLELVRELNKPSALNKKLLIGQGAASNPLCAIHQPLRSAVSQKLFIGGKPVTVTALGSKSDESPMLAFEYLAEKKIAPDTVKKIINDRHCCYLIEI